MRPPLTRAVRAGLLTLPDEQLDVPARITGAVLRFNPDLDDEHYSGVSAALDALPADHPRSEAVLAVVADHDRKHAAFVATHGRKPYPWENPYR